MNSEKNWKTEGKISQIQKKKKPRNPNERRIIPPDTMELEELGAY